MKKHGVFNERPHNEDIDEVYTNLYISNLQTSRNLPLLECLEVTHIVTVMDCAKPLHRKSFDYLVLDEMWDNQECNALKCLPHAIRFIENAF